MIVVLPRYTVVKDKLSGGSAPNTRRSGYLQVLLAMQPVIYQLFGNFDDYYVAFRWNALLLFGVGVCPLSCTTAVVFEHRRMEERTHFGTQLSRVPSGGVSSCSPSVVIELITDLPDEEISFVESGASCCCALLLMLLLLPLWFWFAELVAYRWFCLCSAMTCSPTCYNFLPTMCMTESGRKIGLLADTCAVWVSGACIRLQDSSADSLVLFRWRPTSSYHPPAVPCGCVWSRGGSICCCVDRDQVNRSFR